ncbi:dolichyl-phosphate-mannose-protein mannosyltransferase [Natrinema hispanicum]|uniref:Dolichyl-phosphate-mannose-protein mannosyltransferase n=1 Tax=Natrinema hispanicum TaxID=392421 RepID=A0A482YF26_9EURY|nr:glycosyltransferase family 39 protein [Natrinema hispanicum]RZV11381.1 dolichyl-phosphate-mannose-protein mannosyltransferase [Natrinema hispanicum]
MRRRTWRAAVVAIALAGALAVWLLATRTFPYHSLNHDEGVYLQQAAMLLEGQLFIRPPVEESFRPWFFVDDGDRLYPKYAPVPAAIFALGNLAGGYRLALAGVAAATLALVALIVREVFDRRTAIAAAVIMLCSPLFLIESAVFLPYAPTTMLNLTFAYGYLRADRTGDWRVAGAAGAAIGLAFFARPYTAVLFATPFIAHACWTLVQEPRVALPRQLTTAVFGLTGVGLALAYNATVTGSPLVFPYEAFAPLDGLGFGQRRILNHEIDYTIELALRANARVLAQFVTDWIAGGILGAAVAAVGVGVTIRRGLSPREAILAGLLVTVPVGNVYFWGNFNILGDLERAGDGLIATHGPYYHFDLLVPVAVFGAVGALALAAGARRLADQRLAPQPARAAFVAALLVSALAVGGVTATTVDEKLDRNAAVTDTYEEVYAPLEDGPSERALVFLPTPYGDWLAHPFQALRNDPDIDGQRVYALDERPFAVVDAYPDRSLYRLAYRGAWAPHASSPQAARLQRVDHVAGSAVALNTTVGVPSTAEGVTMTVTTDDDSATAVAANVSEETPVRLTVTDESVRIHGASWDSTEPLPIDDRDDIVVNVFVDQGPGSSFSYRLELPVRTEGDTVRALTPSVERCSSIRDCGGEAAYIPDQSPDGLFVRTELSVSDAN